MKNDGVMIRGLSPAGHDFFNHQRELAKLEELKRAGEGFALWISAAMTVHYRSGYAAKMATKPNKGLVHARARRNDSAKLKYSEGSNDSTLTVKLNASDPSTRVSLLQGQCGTLSASDGLRVVPQSNVGVGMPGDFRD